MVYDRLIVNSHIFSCDCVFYIFFTKLIVETHFKLINSLNLFLIQFKNWNKITQMKICTVKLINIYLKKLSYKNNIYFLLVYFFLLHIYK